jgi:serine protease inhibitor
MKTKICLTVMLAACISCENEKEVPQERKQINISKTTAEIIKSDNDFGLEIFQQVISDDKEVVNTFISPTSIALALAMTYNGADGETKTAMENTLKKKGLTADEINASYKSLIDALISVDPKVLLEIANSIWYREGFTVLPEFISTNQDYYDARVSSLDFNDSGAPDVINGWVSDKTHNRITEIIDEIPPEAVMYLINAIYFKGIWKIEFEKENTSDGLFYLNNGSQISVPMMKQTTTLKHAANEMFSMVELLYGQGNYSMVVLLPQTGYSTDDIVVALTPGNWDEWINSLSEKDVDLQLPKFTFEYKNTLNDELEAMGMGVAFTDMANFSKINGTGNLFISKVLHKSFVEVNEEGTEAAAVTSVEIALTAIPGTENTKFYVDHPFIFTIRETTTGAILFIGRVQNPLIKNNG